LDGLHLGYHAVKFWRYGKSADAGASEYVP
jgi:hypothetical protein